MIAKSHTPVESVAVGLYRFRPRSKDFKARIEALNTAKTLDGDAVAMGAQQQFAQRMIGAIVAALMLVGIGPCAYSQERPSQQPSPFAGAQPFEKLQRPETPSGAMTNSTPSTSMSRTFSPRGAFGVDPDKIEPTAPADQFRLGNSYIGIQTQKTIQTPDQIRRSDCPKDEDCTDYPGQPRSLTSKTGVKNLRKPFIGLSITAPLGE